MEQGDDKSSLHTLEISASELRQLQDQDETLAKCELQQMGSQVPQVLDSLNEMV